MKRSESVYVYAHNDEFCSPQYIGIGVQGRAWEITKRDGTHRNWLEGLSHDFDYVEILHTGLCRDEALKLERGLIRDLDPKYNISERIK